MGELKTKSANDSERPLLIFDTHPIQYRSPVFAALYKKYPALQVHYFNHTHDGRKWWFREVGKDPVFDFKLPLRSGFPSEVIGASEKGMFKLWQTIVGLFKQSSPAAAIIYGYYLPENWIIWLAGILLRVPVIFIGETYPADSSWARRAFKRLVLPPFFFGLRQVISIGSKSNEFYRSFFVPEKRITHAKYCVDTDFFRLKAEAAVAARTQIREALKIPRDAFVGLFVGRLFERKRPQDVFAIYDRLKSNPRFHMVIVGKGPMEADLRERARPLDRVHLVGAKGQGEIRDFYYAGDFLLVPSEFETWGLVVNEAAVAGLPAVITDRCGAAGELTISQQTGFVYPVGDIESAVDFIQSLLDSPEEKNRLGENARQLVLSTYGVDQFAEAMKQAMQKCREES